MKEIKRTIAMSLLIAAFWGLMYPQFSLLEEAYVCVSHEQNPREDFFAVLEAEKGELVLKSRLWELWKERAGQREEKVEREGTGKRIK